MAKLSAHGLEVARLERLNKLSDGTIFRYRVAIMQDGAVLENTGVIDIQCRPGVRWSGWKLVGRKRQIPLMIAKYREAGYEEVVK